MNKLDKLALKQQTYLAKAVDQLQRYIELGLKHEELNNDVGAQVALEETVDTYHKHYGVK